MLTINKKLTRINAQTRKEEPKVLRGILFYSFEKTQKL